LLVTTDLDLWRAAHLLIKQQGDDAAWVAVQRADELLDEGDPIGHETYKRIVRAIDELRRERPVEVEKVN
jgi:hypothetical protein